MQHHHYLVVLVVTAEAETGVELRLHLLSGLGCGLVHPSSSVHEKLEEMMVLPFLLVLAVAVQYQIHHKEYSVSSPFDVVAEVFQVAYDVNQSLPLQDEVEHQYLENIH